MEDEPPPRILRDRSGGADERRLLVLAVDLLLLAIRHAEIREHLRDAPLAIDVARLLVEAEERVERAVVTRVMTDAPGELRRILVGEVLRACGAGAVIGEVDLDADVGARVLELVLEVLEAGLEELDASLEGHRALVGGRLEGHDGRRRRRIVHREVLDDDAVPRLVGGLERLFETAKPSAIEPEAVGHLVELVALVLRDDPVLDDLREELLVHRLELAEPDVARDLSDLETLAVLERRVVHEMPLCNAIGPSVSRGSPMHTKPENSRPALIA
jgi:hypothetical protein